METQERRALSDFRYVEEMPPQNLFTSGLISDQSKEFQQALYASYRNDVNERFNGNPHFRLELDEGGITGSNLFDILLIDEHLKPLGARSALSPLSQELTSRIKGKHYVDFRACVLRSMGDSSCSKNDLLIQKLAEHIDMSQVERGKPALISGLRLEPSEDEGYGVILVLGGEFKAVYDDRLAGKWDGYKFDEVDEHNLPLRLDRKEGSRIWYAREDGLSDLIVGGCLGLDSRGRCRYGSLGSSSRGGRVVLESAEGTRAA